MTEITPGSHGQGDAPPPGSPGASPNVGPVRDSVADLPPGSPTGAARATDEAPSAVVGARRPLDIGQDIDLPAGPGAAPVGTPTLLGVPTTRQAVQPAFDDHHPPDPALIGDCVHCGFCLPTCPTYVLWGEEMDSPRGRVYLMKEALEGEPLDDSMVRHMDRCLGCMACVTACPSGVQYDKLIEATRPQIERNHPRSAQDRWFRRLIFALFPYPRRLRAAAVLGWLYQRLRIGALLRRSGLQARLPARWQALESLLPDVSLRDMRRRLPGRIAARGEQRGRVGLVTGCVQSVYFADVNVATARVLASEGYEVVVPREQGCCGALQEHAGEEPAALRHARRLIATMERADVDSIVINAAGCG